VQIHLD